MPETYAITFHVHPAQRTRFRELLDGVLEAMRHEASFVCAQLHDDPDDPDIFCLHETWADRDDVLNVQLHRPYRAAWNAALPDLLAKPREIRIWRSVRAFDRRPELSSSGRAGSG